MSIEKPFTGQVRWMTADNYPGDGSDIIVGQRRAWVKEYFVLEQFNGTEWVKVEVAGE